MKWKVAYVFMNLALLADCIYEFVVTKELPLIPIGVLLVTQILFFGLNLGTKKES